MRRPEGDDDGAIAFEIQELSGLFAAPRWLRDLGRSSWLAVGVTLFVVALIWLLTLTHTIVAPLLTAAVVAAVASPLVHWLRAHGVPRGVGAALVLVGAVAAAVGVVVIVLAGITSENDASRASLSAAKDTLAQWLADLGVQGGTADSAIGDVSSGVSDAIQALLEGLASGIQSLSSLVVYLSLTALSLFFLLLDGPTIRQWIERHMRVPEPVAHQMGQRVLESLRGYFVGVSLVAAFNAIVVGGGALLLGVPLAGTIAAVTFLGAFVPYLGAWGAGAFSVLVALGGAGTDAAVGMIVVQLLANGILQQMVQPIAFGAALGIHPLAVLVVTIAGGSLFGAVGLILAAPLTSAATRIAADLSRSSAAPTASPPERDPTASPPERDPAPVT
jgi:predicted PurR-regulated permease PerM